MKIPTNRVTLDWVRPTLASGLQQIPRDGLIRLRDHIRYRGIMLVGKTCPRGEVVKRTRAGRAVG